MTPPALECVARFRRYITTERRLSAHTDTNYARDLAALVKYCDQQGLEDWGSVDSQHVRSFAAQSHAHGLSARSIQRRLSAVRGFFEFLMREETLRREEAARGERAAGRMGITKNPAYEVRAPKTQ